MVDLQMLRKGALIRLKTREELLDSGWETSAWDEDIVMEHSTKRGCFDINTEMLDDLGKEFRIVNIEAEYGGIATFPLEDRLWTYDSEMVAEIVAPYPNLVVGAKVKLKDRDTLLKEGYRGEPYLGRKVAQGKDINKLISPEAIPFLGKEVQIGSIFGEGCSMRFTLAIEGEKNYPYMGIPVGAIETFDENQHFQFRVGSTITLYDTIDLDELHNIKVVIETDNLIGCELPYHQDPNKWFIHKSLLGKTFEVTGYDGARMVNIKFEENDTTVYCSVPVELIDVYNPQIELESEMEMYRLSMDEAMDKAKMLLQEVTEEQDELEQVSDEGCFDPFYQPYVGTCSCKSEEEIKKEVVEEIRKKLHENHCNSLEWLEGYYSGYQQALRHFETLTMPLLEEMTK